MIDVVVVGSANLDVVVGTARHPAPGETVLGHSYDEYAGGKGLNQAVAAARCGAAVAFVGAVGADEPGQRLIDVAAAEGIDISQVVRHRDVPTGRAVIVVDEHGENSIVVVPGANHLVPRADHIARARVVVAQLEVPVPTIDTAFRRARQAGAITVLNPAPARELPAATLASCDVIIPNEHEVTLLGGIEHLHECGVATVIVTHGAAGVTLSRSTGDRLELPAIPVDVVDTTGAGDAFCGNFAARLAAGDDEESAARWAAGAGALAVTVAGAVPSLPRRADVAELLARPR